MTTVHLQLSLSLAHDLIDRDGNTYRRSIWRVRYDGVDKTYVVVHYNTNTTHLRIDPELRIFASQKRLIGLTPADNPQALYYCCNLFDTLDRTIPISAQINNQNWLDVKNQLLEYLTAGYCFRNLIEYPSPPSLLDKCAIVVKRLFPNFREIPGLPSDLFENIAESDEMKYFSAYTYSNGTEMAEEGALDY